MLDGGGEVLGEGFHRGAGTPHAEVAAIEAALEGGSDLQGSTAVVSLEPCRHTGRTGPCTEALRAAGVSRVVYAVEEPGEQSGGGAQELAAAGIDVDFVSDAEAHLVNRPFLHAVATGRPYVIAKFASTLDGRTAAEDGTSFWITGEAAREHAHQTRARADAIVVGSGTIAIDDPRLSARPGGADAAHQPLRVVMGTRDTSGKQVWRDENATQIRTHDPAAVLAELTKTEARLVIVEGGPTVTTAFLGAGLVDEVHAYVAPAILGAGTPAIGALGIETMNAALRLTEVTIEPLGNDVLVAGRVTRG